jgi:hypothetical protein
MVGEWEAEAKISVSRFGDIERDMQQGEGGIDYNVEYALRNELDVENESPRLVIHCCHLCRMQVLNMLQEGGRSLICNASQRAKVSVQIETFRRPV